MSISPGSPGHNELLDSPGDTSLVTLDVRLTSTGTLTVTSSTTPAEVVCVTPHLLKDYGRLLPVNTDLLLSPCGRLARYIGPASSGLNEARGQKSGSKDSEEYDVNSRSWQGLFGKTWSTLVTKWLAGRGIYLSDEKYENWLEVQLPPFPNPVAGNETSSGIQSLSCSGMQTVLWPAELCCTRLNPESEARDRDLDWMQPHNGDDNLHDPLVFAEEWYKSKILRDDLLESAKLARQNDELLTHQFKSPEAALQDSNLMDDPYIRVNNYLELHAANLVYPTPPDGALTQGSIGALAHNGTGSTPGDDVDGNNDQSASTGVDHEDGLARSSNIDDDVYETGERRQSDASQIAMLPAVYDASDGDLFGDIDTDMFGTSGITEADFSFFDQPDMGDIEGQIFDSMDTMTDRDNNLHTVTTAHNVQEVATSEIPNVVHSDLEELGTSVAATPSLDAGIFDQSVKAVTCKNFPDRDAVLPTGVEDNHSLGTSLLTDAGDVEHGDAGNHGFPSPPLSPLSVKNKLLPQLTVSSEGFEHCTNPSNHHPGAFARVAFAGTVHFSDQKYHTTGRFSAARQEDQAPWGSDSGPSDIPSIGFPLQKLDFTPEDAVDNSSDILVQESDDLLSSKVVSEAGQDMEENPWQIQCLNEHGVNEALGEEAFVTAGVKRKRDAPDDADALAEVTDGTRPNSPTINSQSQILLPSLTQFLPSASDLPLVSSKRSSSKDLRRLLTVRDDDYIRIAQILTDQVVSSSLRFSRHQPTCSQRLSSFSTARKNGAQGAITEVLESFFRNSYRCDLETYAAIEDLPLNPPVTVQVPCKHPRRAKPGGDVAGHMNGHIFKLPAPHVCVQRGEAHMEVLAPALPFWETLGLGPVSGTKDVRAFAIYPPIEGLEDAVNTFLEELGNTYESCKLGSHTRGDYLGQPRPGLVSTIAEEADASFENIIFNINAACEQLGTSLAGSQIENRNVVVYMIDMFSRPDAVVHLCAAFLRLYQTYIQAEKSSRSTGPNEIVLQLIPINLIASKVSVVVPTQQEYRALALEVYERCGLETGPTMDSASVPGNAPGILLSDKIPSSLDFSLRSEPPMSVLHEPSTLHVAYSQGVGGRWISVSWTDSEGNHQMSMSYCLGSDETEPRRAFQDVAREVWETSIGLARARKGKWRLIIARVGIMEPDELAGKLRNPLKVSFIAISNTSTFIAWTLVADESGQGMVTLVLLAVDIRPALSLLPSENETASNSLNMQSTLYTTPISTPQPMILSPEYVGAAATPASGNGPTNAGTPTDNAFEIDPEASLIDVSDESWGMLLRHRIHNTRSLTERRPGLASGYLIKRAGRHDEDGIVAMSVNLLQGDSPYDPQLRDILTMYRGLGTIARLKGLAHPIKSVMPWHVAAAVEAQEALSSLM
ncbi:mediator of RNA polymerase II transcription subunit 13 [Acarospora aff. strigata]|nr:mediator of RNA polymerase II transcription subunit 13 [Acarospora aff. strigata]